MIMHHACFSIFKVKLSKDAQKLEVVEVTEDHNHEVDKVKSVHIKDVLEQCSNGNIK